MVVTKPPAIRVLTELFWYIGAFATLQKQYRETPEWRFIRQQRLLRKMERLTKDFERKVRSWGI